MARKLYQPFESGQSSFTFRNAVRCQSADGFGGADAVAITSTRFPPPPVLAGCIRTWAAWTSRPCREWRPRSGTCSPAIWRYRIAAGEFIDENRSRDDSQGVFQNFNRKVAVCFFSTFACRAEFAAAPGIRNRRLSVVTFPRRPRATPRATQRGSASSWTTWKPGCSASCPTAPGSTRGTARTPRSAPNARTWRSGAPGAGRRRPDLGPSPSGPARAGFAHKRDAQHRRAARQP